MKKSFKIKLIQGLLHKIFKNLKKSSKIFKNLQKYENDFDLFELYTFAFIKIG
jgi:hypothetical protein